MKVEVKDYLKIIKGRTILDHVNYSFDSGKIYGLYGRNGSGKTMLMRAIAGLIYPTEGKVLIDGKELHKDISFPSDTGIIIENMELMPQYDAYTNLKLLSKIQKKATDEDIKEALDKVGLANTGKSKVRTFSLGMKQKLSIAQAIFEKPKLLMLDEPTNALDEKSVEDVRKLLLELKNQGTTIIIASHNKEDINNLSDVVLEVDNGKIKERVVEA
ncbi:ATP-binding cassette domain-containing protein [Eubacterium sp.]|uniref:ATP-binding cassette domain-containing protein n=1 Tax=Eubacterium sp. TaxID=142586 RepID=UPI0025D9B6D9|nr:ATP-binding cassette domain-containing protein [Eubacterium sp.]MCR5628514.1 ATP-binding cassette domain-containing protein [Eubacterium sp.]